MSDLNITMPDPKACALSSWAHTFLWGSWYHIWRGKTEMPVSDLLFWGFQSYCLFWKGTVALAPEPDPETGFREPTRTWKQRTAPNLSLRGMQALMWLPELRIRVNVADYWDIHYHTNLMTLTFPQDKTMKDNICKFWCFLFCLLFYSVYCPFKLLCSWEGVSGWGTHVVHPWLIHINVWQKPLQYCKVISLQLK